VEEGKIEEKEMRERRRGESQKISVRTSLVKHRPPLHSASLSCGIASLSRESNHDVEHDLEALPTLPDV
jgi:hypothetical protein